VSHFNSLKRKPGSSDSLAAVAEQMHRAQLRAARLRQIA
jgi:hypothetical protein